ncbi:hypothetical protein PRO82_002247 [Candidatus Protochlamydia amoebophila]|nr:hypothetical protein [Candidatus Protochlamydia amoebophila]
MINLMSMIKPFFGSSIEQLARNLVRLATLKNLILLLRHRYARFLRKTFSFSKKLN